VLAASSSSSNADAPVAYLPDLSVTSFSVTSPAEGPGSDLQLTPAGCAAGECTGFTLSSSTTGDSSTPDGSDSTGTNTATFVPNDKVMSVDVFRPMTFELGTLQLTHGGYAMPPAAAAPPGSGPAPPSLIIGLPSADIDVSVGPWSGSPQAAAATAAATAQGTGGDTPDTPTPPGSDTPLVPVSVSMVFATQDSGSSTNVTVPFVVQWLPASSPTAGHNNNNNAGMFVLVTHESGSTPAPSQEFTVALTPEVNFTMKITLVGFTAADVSNSNIAILGDWGQQPPADGQPGPRVFVKEGAGPQAVKLQALITRVFTWPSPSVSN
jgi:hypothetical protein